MECTLFWTMSEVLIVLVELKQRILFAADTLKIAQQSEELIVKEGNVIIPLYCVALGHSQEFVYTWKRGDS